MQFAGALVEAERVQLCASIAFYPLDTAIQRCIVRRAEINPESVVVWYTAGGRDRVVGSENVVRQHSKCRVDGSTRVLWIYGCACDAKELRSRLRDVCQCRDNARLVDGRPKEICVLRDIERAKMPLVGLARRKCKDGWKEVIKDDSEIICVMNLLE